jgi:glycosyltransferase involved in cell wall biosynthesis
MTASAEPPVLDSGPDGPFGPAWRDAMASAQRSVLPSGRVVVTCSAPLGVGGLGRHLKEISEALERRGEPTHCSCGPPDEADAKPRRTRGVPDLACLLARLPIPLSMAVRTRAAMVEFDDRAARNQPDADHLIAFNGQALKQFRAAKRARYESVALVSANSHIRQVARQHALARRQYPLEGSWTTNLLRRNLTEYERADRIYVASDYIRASFIEEGFHDDVLARFQCTPDPRYRRERPSQTSGTFEIVYVGSLAVHKGVPLLIDAVRRLPQPDIRLRLVGGWATRGMRRFIQTACAEDPRISSGPGDPLDRLRAASLYVHPSFEDGFAYAAAEALACGVPVIVSDDTGMKDLIDSPRAGLVLPTGDLTALSEAIEAAYRGEIFGG